MLWKLFENVSNVDRIRQQKNASFQNKSQKRHEKIGRAAAAGAGGAASYHTKEIVQTTVLLL
jgi:hypothetical protein